MSPFTRRRTPHTDGGDAPKADYIIGPDGPPTLVECDSDEQGKRMSQYVEDLVEALWCNGGTE